MTGSRGSAGVAILFVSAALATVAVHAIFVLARLPDLSRAAPYVIVGWISFALAFYAMGRLFSSPDDLPSMRLADVGLALFFLAALAGIALDSFGLPPDAIAEAYVLPTVAIYVGLAMLSWAFGRRSKAINRISGGE